MPAVTGRSPGARTITVTTTSGATSLTGSSGTFNPEDAGRKITGTGIPAGATIATVTNSTTAALSANATASGSITATLPDVSLDSVKNKYGFRGWSPESSAEAGTYTIPGGASASMPGKITDDHTSEIKRYTRA